MMPVEPSGTTPPVLVIAPPATGAQAAGTTGLSLPIFDGPEPTDALAMLLMAMEKSGRLATEETETRIRTARAALKDQLDAFLDKLRESIEAAQRAQEEDDGGFFGDIIDAVADVVGAIVGTFVDFAADMVTTPIELAVDIVKNLGDSQALLGSIRSNMLELVQNGEVAESARGFTSGILEFAADLATFGAEVGVALTRAAATGSDPTTALADPLKRLWSSCEKNILDNPHFWEVAGVVAKAAVVVGAAASGGVLGAAVLVAMAALEIDQHTGFIEKAVGSDAAPWVRLGIGIAASTCLAFASGASGELGHFLRIANGTASIVGGVAAGYQGYRAMVDGAERADELDRQGDLQAMRNRMDQLHRLISSLIDLLRDQNEDGNTRREIASDLVATQAATQQAALFHA